MALPRGFHKFYSSIFTLKVKPKNAINQWVLLGSMLVAGKKTEELPIKKFRGIKNGYH